MSYGLSSYVLSRALRSAKIDAVLQDYYAALRLLSKMFTLRCAALQVVLKVQFSYKGFLD